MEKIYTKTYLITQDQADRLFDVLTEHQFQFFEKKYTIYSAKKDKLNISIYENGPKLLLQGKGIEDFITFILEPEVLNQATFGYDEILDPKKFTPHFGIDESGKGDFFGPLVISGVYVDEKIARQLRDSGIRDSKTVGSDKQIRNLAQIIRRIRAPFDTVLITPATYNKLYDEMHNLNSLLAWGHARVIENLCVRFPECKRALSDKFAHHSVLTKSLLKLGSKIELEQQTKAESDYAVAAASILARESFINWLDHKTEEIKFQLNRGVSNQVKQTAQAIITSQGKEILRTIAKLHFKTTAEILSNSEDISSI